MHQFPAAFWASYSFQNSATGLTRITGLPEHKIRVISPDIGGGFGNKVPLYPGYLCVIVGSMISRIVR